MCDSHRLIDFVRETIQQHNPNVDSSSLCLRNSWESRTATLHTYGVNGSPASDVVVKVLKDSKDASRLYQSMRETHDLLSKVHPQQVPDFSPYGYSADLGAVMMPYVSGTSLAAILQTGADGAGSLERIRDYVFRCGQILGAYHEKFQDHRRTSLERAVMDFEYRIQPLLGKKAEVALELMGDAIISRSYGDYHPGHMIITETGKQAVPIDPPLYTRYKFVYRDLSWFIDELFMLHLHPTTHRSGLHRVWQHEELADKFIEGYTDSFHFLRENLHTLDRALLGGFEAFLLKRRLQRLWNPKRMPQLAYFGVPLLRRYHRLRHELMVRIQREP
ncbi:MAG: hypothetical protein IT328_19660 [Caldilineaceae bacterium]|nr:hypothetical protein [Caldilineaceae bacterium]